MKKVVTLGEILLRLSAQEGVRLNQAGRLHVHYGGAEANVAVSLARYGYEAFVVSKIPDNPLGMAAERQLKSHGVRTDYVLKGGERLGTYYLEPGAGVRSAQVTYDRKYSSFSEMEVDEVVVEDILRGAALFHVSGITLALSASLREIVLLFMKKAKEIGIKTSFDFNYRAKLWTQREASDAIKPLLPYMDICFFGELDAVHLLGLKKREKTVPQEDRLKEYYKEVLSQYPTIQAIGSTFRTVLNATSNKLQGNLFTGGELYQSKVHQLEPIIDRVGGGDAFASGMLWGLLEGLPPGQIVSFAAAASALKHTVHGDCHTFTKEEIIQFAAMEPGTILR
ncbi:MAG TPA: sugar kinase [Bacillaceae bacterium]